MVKEMPQSSVFQPFCCSGTLRKCQNHLRNPMHESSSVSVVKVLVCLRTDVFSGVKRQKTSVDLGAKPPKADDKTAGKVKFACN